QVATVPLSLDEDVAPEYLPLPTESEKRILAELDKPTKMEFSATPLEKAVDYLKSLHKIDILLDNKALEDAGYGSDTPVTLKLENVKLVSALRWLLRDMDLTYLIKDEVLLVTTKDKADTELLTRTYPVSDLIDGNDGNAYDNLIEAITGTVKPTTWDEVGGPGSLIPVPKSKSLVISQTRDVHDEVLDLWGSLGAAGNVSRMREAGKSAERK